MAITSRKLSTYAKDVKALGDTPNDDGLTAAQLKAVFMGAADEEIKTNHNGLIDDLLAITDGSSGADNIGATAVKVGGEETVQGILEELKTDKTEESAFTTHKTSADHDGRYYTEAEIDTKFTNHNSSNDHDSIYYTKSDMQTSGQSSVHWGNLTNIPNMADSSWKTAVANRAALPLTGNSVNDQRVVLDDGDGKQAMYVCIATTGDVDAQWDKIGDVDWTNDHGNLVGLGDDDHTQYHNDVRGDARYYKKAEVDTLLDDKSGVVVREKEFTATAGQTAFDVSSVGTYVPGSNLMNVYKKNIAGVYEELDRDTFTETSGTVVTLVYPAMVNDEYRFRWYENNPEYLNGAYAKKDGTLQTGLNADLLDGQQGSYYLDFANITNGNPRSLYYGKLSQMNGIINSTNDSVVTFSAEDFDDFSAIDIATNNERITIPAALNGKRVRIYLQGKISQVSSGLFGVNLRKNLNVVKSNFAYVSNTGTNIIANSFYSEFITPVATGDYFDLTVSTTSAVGRLDGDAKFGIEVLG